MKTIVKIPRALEKKLWQQVLNYRKQDKIAYLNYRSIVARNNRSVKSKAILFCLSYFYFHLNEFRADASSSETNNSEILNLESLKFSILDNTHEILLDNSCDRDKNFFDTDIQNTPSILHEEFENFSCKLNSNVPQSYI